MRFRDICEGIGNLELSSYGYWIKPDGDIIPCDDQSHAQTIADENGDFDWDADGDDDAEHEMVKTGLEQGGIRVVAGTRDPIFYAEWGFSVSHEAREALLDLMKLYSNREFMVGGKLVPDLRTAMRIVREG